MIEDRAEAGRLLAEEIARRHFPDPVVLGLVRGGLPVAAEIARALSAPLDILLVRKIGAPAQPELAVGAIVDGGNPEVLINDELARLTGADESFLEHARARALEEIERRRRLYLGDRAPTPIEGRTAIVVDDGIATGATVRVALKGLRRRRPAKLVVAVGVAPPDTVAMLEREADEVICLEIPRHFSAISPFYRDFRQVRDDEVMAILADVRKAAKPSQG